MAVIQQKKITMFTFKTEKSTGFYRSFYPDTHYIKLKRAKVGVIEDKRPTEYASWCIKMILTKTATRIANGSGLHLKKKVIQFKKQKIGSKAFIMTL